MKQYSEDYIRKDLKQENEDLQDDIWEEFTRFFREEKGYDDWTDEQINFSINDDDIDEFIEYLKDNNIIIEKE